ncbi:MAG: hypoxanthine phosphoribosyltransferase [Chloroflexi bacterium]|nr:hypoxanthine phosphoribosyltransferase [Chloroflexota bacterium]MCI0575135.1 hypoxanthine phosphoribosyltransferase [Chloroflexota bacterium]MCI0646284.1 hypoxanthine phosphoribosyltransferase [Chloroflexota bacterium]MCI0728629.1 hypoxanthine phosphoribosyltransferase [Chloroflexota bacterium]
MSSYHPPEAYEELAAGIREILIPAEEIERRIMELGAAISRDYEGCNPLLVGVLKGVVPFMAALMQAITIPMEVDYMAVSSYSAGARGAMRGAVRLEKDLGEPIAGRHVLFVEDVIDTGLTLNYLLRSLKAREPATLKVCTLFNKPEHRLVDIPLHYKGFDLPDRFVVGYGLDYRERYRNLPFVGLLSPEVFQRSDKNGSQKG